jgi:hypothetical protein
MDPNLFGWDFLCLNFLAVNIRFSIDFVAAFHSMPAGKVRLTHRCQQHLAFIVLSFPTCLLA